MANRPDPKDITVPPVGMSPNGWAMLTGETVTAPDVLGTGKANAYMYAYLMSYQLPIIAAAEVYNGDGSFRTDPFRLDESAEDPRRRMSWRFVNDKYDMDLKFQTAKRQAVQSLPACIHNSAAAKQNVDTTYAQVQEVYKKHGSYWTEIGELVARHDAAVWIWECCEKYWNSGNGAITLTVPKLGSTDTSWVVTVLPFRSVTEAIYIPEEAGGVGSGNFVGSDGSVVSAGEQNSSGGFWDLLSSYWWIIPLAGVALVVVYLVWF
jgi:hypothetical protein